MKVCAIICEYNPFHTGHEYHINQAREKTGADVIVALMSGNFTQRGDGALFDKWVRASAAVSCGADIVIELPFCYAAQTAEFFATGAVKMLEKCGCIDYLAFGCETDELSVLENAASITESDALKDVIASGKSYPAALSEAGGNNVLSPNNILAIEYLRALKSTDSKIKPVPIKREGEGYNSEVTDGNFISATACRLLFEKGDFNTLQKYIPQKSLNIFRAAYNDGRIFESENLAPYVLGNLRTKGISADGAYVAEGIHNRINSASFSADDIASLFNLIKTKRYTMARIKRTVLNGVFGISRNKLEKYVSDGCGFLNVLASNSDGYAFLNEVKNKSDSIVISKISDRDNLPCHDREIFDLDYITSSVYYLGMKNKKYRTADAEIRRGYGIDLC